MPRARWQSAPRRAASFWIATVSGMLLLPLLSVTSASAVTDEANSITSSSRSYVAENRAANNLPALAANTCLDRFARTYAKTGRSPASMKYVAASCKTGPVVVLRYSGTAADPWLRVKTSSGANTLITTRSHVRIGYGAYVNTAKKASLVMYVARPRHRMFVVGDSMTARGSATMGSKSVGWWKRVAVRLNMDVATSAQSGSGFIRRGGIGCRGTTFTDRLRAIAKADPDVLVIAGGRNDFRQCHVGRAETLLTARQSQKGIETYMARVAALAKQLRIPRSNVYIATPWGYTLQSKRTVIARYVRQSAKAHGFKFIDLPPLARKETVDGTHPNYAGNRRLYTNFLDRRRSDLRARFTA